jgi:hypothetical protein
MRKGASRLLDWFSSEKDYGNKIEEQLNIDSTEYQDNLDVFLAKALKDRIFSIYSVFLLLILIFIIIDWVYGSTIYFQTYGLLLDVAGAIILARGLFRGEQEIIFDIQEANLGPSAIVDDQEYSSASITVEMLNTADGVIGVIFLVLGFSVQIVSSLP